MVAGNSKGFTLIELLVAMTILAIGLLGVAGMQSTALRENSSSHARTSAAALASGIMEEIRQWNPEDPRLSADSTGNVWVFPDGGEMTQIAGAGVFRATYNVAVNFSGVSSVSNINRIQVDVTGPGRPVRLVSFRKGN